MLSKNNELFNKHAQSYQRDVDNAVAFTGLNVDFFTRVKADYVEVVCLDHFGQTKNLDVLDIGCGVGNFHPFLSRIFGSLSGVDVSPASIDRAREANPSVKYKVYEGGRLPYDDNSFDMACTICVMHHVRPELWPDFCSEFHRVVKKDGIGIIFEHNPRNPLTMRAVNNCPFDVDAVLLRSEETESLMQGGGFVDVRSKFILAVPARYPLLRKIDQLFSALPIGAQYYTRGVKA